MLRSQVLLIALLAALALYLVRLRTTPRDRLLYIVMVGVAIPLVLFPDVSNTVAHAVGIGRGADLVFYLFIVFSLFHFATIASRIRRLERQITQLVQDRALEAPEPPTDQRPSSR
jgi:hypothetical protein